MIMLFNLIQIMQTLILIKVEYIAFEFQEFHYSM